jgi:hypothetical protein
MENPLHHFFDDRTDAAALEPRLSTADWTGIPGIIQHRRISPPDPQVFAGLDLTAIDSS